MHDDNNISEELVKFRTQWKAEVQARQAQVVPSTDSKDTPNSSSHAHHTPVVQKPGATQVVISGNATSLPPGAAAALQNYRQAVKSEQDGEIDEALKFYQIAFRMHPDVDILHRREEILSGTAQHTHHVPHVKQTTDIPENKHVKMPSVSRSTLQKVMEGFFQEGVEPVFLPEEEEIPVYIQHIPNEILIHILRMLDITSLECFASICRKARVITLDADIWRCVHTSSHYIAC